jgi:sulfofructose kinase
MSTEMPAVVGLGYCAYDILAIVPYMPEFDDVRMTHASALVHDGGGPVGTSLAALARLGVPSGYVGVLGDDPEGRWLREMFIQEGVDVSRLRMSDEVGTNVCLLLVEQGTARRAIACHPRVSPSALVLDDADRRYVQAARVLHLDGQFLPAAVQAARWAREAGVRVCLDGNHPRPGLEELLPLVDWLVVAEPFPQEATGLHDANQAARALLRLGPEMLLVTLGEAGCRAWIRPEAPGAAPKDPLCLPAFAVEAVDTTGAGDAFHGGFLYGMLQAWELPRVLAFANAVAGLSCQTLGGRRGLPDLTAVLAFLDAHQARAS